jgi:hypothetical protein
VKQQHKTIRSTTQEFHINYRTTKDIKSTNLVPSEPASYIKNIVIFQPHVENQLVMYTLKALGICSGMSPREVQKLYYKLSVAN